MLKKALNYYKKYGFKETVLKVYRRLVFKLKLKLNRNKKGLYKLSDSEKELITLKTKKVHIFMNIPYYDIGGGQRGSQLAKTFNRMGYLVNYVYLHESSETEKITLEFPLNRHDKLSDVKVSDYEFESDDIVIFEAPSKEFLPFLDKAYKKCQIVYETIDNWETTLGNGFFDKNVLENFLKKSDMLVATSIPLVEQVEKYLKDFKIKKQVFYLANAVDSDMFDARREFVKPNDMVIGKKTLLYYGSLWGSWFDWNLVFDIAKDDNVEINLIGDFGGITDIVSKAPNNVHFLGLKKQSELPHYLKYCDFAILPFKVDEIGKYVSPLKVFEYISMGCPVLSTPLDDIIDYPNVYCSNSSKEWLKYIKSDIKIINYTSFIDDNNWYNRCSKILNELKNQKCDKKFYGNISIVILNYNNKNVIFNCIDTIKKYNDKYNAEIIVVDNQSTDGSYELLKKNYKDIKLYRNTKNGCSSGRNLGVSKANGEYIMFLDSDQWVMYQNWLDCYIDIFNTNDVGAIGWAGGWFNSDGYAYHTVFEFPHNYMPPMGLVRSDIGYIGTGGLMMRKDLFDQIEGFDLYYDPTCYEDTDLSLKIRNAHKEIYYCPYLGVGHLPHQTTKSGSDKHDTLIREKGDYFVKKWNEINPELLNYKK